MMRAADAQPAGVPKEQLWGPAALAAKREAQRRHQAMVASQREQWITANPYYYRGITRVLQFIVEPDRRVLDVRCQTGVFLDALGPARGVGVELTEEMAAIARRRCPQHHFVVSDPEAIELADQFDYILFQQPSDTVDVLEVLHRLEVLADPHGRLVVYSYNDLWEPLISLAERCGLKMPQPEPNWLSEADIINLIELGGFEWLRTYRVMLLPKRIPLLSEFVNRVVARLPLIDRLCMINILVARKSPQPRDPRQLSVSVIVPCKNEVGNIEAAVRRIPALGRHTEIIFCDDKSTDGTADEVRRMQRECPHLDIRLVDGPGVGKAENVWAGFRAASGDVLMILDADLTVMPEELPGFLNTLAQGKADFVNGSRLVYPMQRMAMKWVNMIGNKFFSYVFSYLLDRPVRDTLCGTKVLWRSDWLRIEPLLGSWGVTDRWGDYELLFGAAKLQLKIVDLPVHYQERLFGATKMTRVFNNGWRMLRMCWAGFRKLKVGY